MAASGRGYGGRRSSQQAGHRGSGVWRWRMADDAAPPHRRAHGRRTARHGGMGRAFWAGPARNGPVGSCLGRQCSLWASTARPAKELGRAARMDIYSP